jgi:hypothetical protein
MANLVMLTARSTGIALRGTVGVERGIRTCSSQAMG